MRRSSLINYSRVRKAGTPANVAHGAPLKCLLLLMALMSSSLLAAQTAPVKYLPGAIFKHQQRSGFNLFAERPPVPGQITVDDFEITQSVQDMTHRVPIIAGKTTVVRAYLSYDSNNCIAVKGVLSLTLPTGETKQFSSSGSIEVNPALNGNTQRKRESEKASLNFRVPASEIALPENQATGKLRAQLSLIEYDPAGPRTCHNVAAPPVEPLICDNCSVKFREVDVVESPTLRVRLVGLNYRKGGSATIHTPTAKDVALTKSWLARAYPVAQSKLFFVPEYSTVDAVIDFNSAYPCNDANARLSILRGDEINNRLATISTHYFGLVSDKGNFMGGCSSQIPAAAMFPPAVASGPAGPPAKFKVYKWDADGSYADFYTGHELAHTMGRKHPGFCSETKDDAEYEFQGGKLSNPDEQFIGFDVGDPEINPPLPMKAMRGTEWADVMTYCAKRWLSSYTYKAILSWLQTENKLDPTLPPPPPPLPPPMPPLNTVNAISAAIARPLPNISAPADKMVLAVQEDNLDRGEFIQVVATVDLDKHEGHISSARRRSVTTGANVSVKRVEHPAKIRLKDEDDKSLDQYFVLIQETTIEPEQPEPDTVDAADSNEAQPVDEPISKAPATRERAGLIDAIIPYIPGTAKIELILFKKEGETESEVLADTYIVSKSPPKTNRLRATDSKLIDSTNKISSLNVLTQTANDASLIVSWKSKATEGQQVTYKVEISSGEADDWRTLAVGLTKTSYEIPPDQLPKGPASIRIRVTASDGFNTTKMTSKRIQLP